jgi:MFS family permease
MPFNSPASDDSKEQTQPDQIASSTTDTGTQPDRRTAFSAFKKSQKRWIVFLAAFAGWFSTLSSFIFFPAITSLALHLHTSIQNINLTVTSYLLFAAVAPARVGTYADNAGRRPAYLASLAVYFAANIGLALQTSFPALFVLRMVQSAGIAGPPWLFFLTAETT